MSFISDQLRHTDAQLGRFQFLSRRDLVTSSAYSTAAQNAIDQHPQTQRLESAIRHISHESSNGTILNYRQIWDVLERGGVGSRAPTRQSGQEYGTEATEEYRQELEWILVSKAAVQVQSWLLTLFLREIAPVMDDIYYWDGVLGSWRYSALYMAQRTPDHLWIRGKDALDGAWQQLQQVQTENVHPMQLLTRNWRRFYDLVLGQLRTRSVSDFQSRLISPVNLARLDASSRLKGLHKQKEMCAAAIGILANESLVFDIDPTPSDSQDSDDEERAEKVEENWKETVSQSVQLMASVLRSVTCHKLETQEYEDSVFTAAKNEAPTTDDVRKISSVLAGMLIDTVPEHVVEYQKNRRSFGKPSRLVRYWMPALALTLSSSTLLRIAVARQAEIMTWVRELGQTTVDFWYNWVVEPIKRLIGTIRHDESSEIALMSRESLAGDRASLERMVVDFAIEHPDTAGGGPLTDTQINQIRAKVKEGDLTQVLRAYEHDLKRPLARAVTGNLIRELLIQIQKTKVDVEVAMAGIDSLLKSQELVFGFVSLTPGLLVCVALGRWLGSTFGGRKGRARDKHQTRMIRILRNIDCILTEATPQDGSDILRYRDHGLILCEVQDLQASGEKILPGVIYREFIHDLRSLTNIHQGVHRQAKVVERLRWAYWKWIS